ncbi:hypothetical protein EDC04DRAFT_2896638 [Pisolithus marmoratus]|nr:hypothetical protein EDC04DRAFT_2896638 [Pisolithus marmoratus]
MQDAPPPNTFSLRGRVQVIPAVSSSQVEQPADHKGKQKQPLPLQVEPACPPMEYKITPSDLYANVPMTIDELIVQGTMFPNFDRTELPYRVLHLGQGNDSVRSVLFMRINDNLYAYGNEMIGKVIMKGQYRALLEWAEVAPANSTPVPWEGEFTHLATVADVAAYLVANGIMYHNADNALKWAWRAGNEYVAQVISNGGDKDPNTKTHVLAVTPKSIVPYKACPIEERDLFTLEEFTKSAALYDLPH